jgi:hypothetical protein
MGCGAVSISHIPGAEHTAAHRCSCLEADEQKEVVKVRTRTRKDGLHSAQGHACGPGQSTGACTIDTEQNKIGRRIHGDNDQHHCKVRDLSKGW